MTATLCAVTFSNSYVLWHKRCVMLRFVAAPSKHCIRKPQVWELSRPCPETSTKLYVHEFGFSTRLSKNPVLSTIMKPPLSLKFNCTEPTVIINSNWPCHISIWEWDLMEGPESGYPPGGRQPQPPNPVTPCQRLCHPRPSKWLRGKRQIVNIWEWFRHQAALC